MKNWLGIIAVTFTLFAGAVGGLEYFAKAKDLDALAMDFQEERKFNRIQRIEERIWDLEKRNKDKQQWDECDEKEYRKLKLEIDQLKSK